MTSTAVRNIVRIDPQKCNGCGLCVPSCAEGAIEIVDGKARLVAENLCDGLGACLGECPQGAISIEQRPAEVFDEHAARHRKGWPHQAGGPGPAGCPGAMLKKLKPPAGTVAEPQADIRSQLRHWPVQLALVPVKGELWQDADVLIAADCVAFAMPDFHRRLLAGKSLAVACPKLDEIAPHIEKLSAIFAGNDIKSVTVAHMEVPCCGGIVGIVRQALQQAGKTDAAFHEITVGMNGAIEAESKKKGKHQ